MLKPKPMNGKRITKHYELFKKQTEEAETRKVKTESASDQIDVQVRSCKDVGNFEKTD